MIHDNTVVCDVLQMDVSLFRLAIVCILNLGYFGECLRDTQLGDPCSRTGNKKCCVLVAGDIISSMISASLTLRWHRHW